MTVSSIAFSGFAPAERSTPAQVATQAQRFLDIAPAMRYMLDAVPDTLLVLNATRQVVFANRAMLDLLECTTDELLGRRPGEALVCLHALGEAGCGAAEFCRTCGALRAILASQQGRVDVQECRITRSNGEALDLRVHATPFNTVDESFTIFVMSDVSHEKRRRALEHIFFHDILNTATAIRAATDLLERTEPKEMEELSGITRRLVQRLITEIQGQQQLVDAENDELTISPARLDAARVVEEVAEAVGRHEVGRSKRVQLHLPQAPLELVSDQVLLQRVLGNMMKNALEASHPGETVTVSCVAAGAGVQFDVHNAAVMSQEVQLQIFQRSFSTKGVGRGLGTYSMKLLSERYLGGRVSFSSRPGAGTTFSAWFPLRPAAGGISR